MATKTITSEKSVTSAGSAGTKLYTSTRTTYTLDENGKIDPKSVKTELIYYDAPLSPGVVAATKTGTDQNWTYANKPLSNNPILGKDAQKSLKEGALKTTTNQQIQQSTKKEGLTPEQAKAISPANANTATTDAAQADQRAVTAGSYANSGYIIANTANQRAVTSGVYANTAYVHANAAYIQANTADQRALTGGDYANAAFTQANTATQVKTQNLQTGNYTLQLTDAGKHIYYTQATSNTLFIPTTSNVAFLTGTTIMIVSKTSSSANITVSPNTGVSMFLAGNTTSASRNVTTHGVVTLINVAANTWFISGSGVV